MSKECNRCHLVLDESSFYIDTNSRKPIAICKKCSNERTRKYRLENLEARRQHDRDYYAANREEIYRKNTERYALAAEDEREKAKEWRDSDKGKRHARLRFQHRSPEDRIKVAAKEKVRTEINAGRMQRPTKCSKCGFESTNSRYIQAHHYDYSKPLDIVWLCAKCHKAAHRKEKMEKIS